MLYTATWMGALPQLAFHNPQSFYLSNTSFLVYYGLGEASLCFSHSCLLCLQLKWAPKFWQAPSLCLLVSHTSSRKGELSWMKNLRLQRIVFHGRNAHYKFWRLTIHPKIKVHLLYLQCFVSYVFCRLLPFKPLKTCTSMWFCFLLIFLPLATCFCHICLQVILADFLVYSALLSFFLDCLRTL